MSGMATYRMIGGRNWLVDDWHRAQAAALHSLAKEHGGPIAPSQLADALQVSVDDLTPVALVKNGHAFFRGPRGSSRMLWPREGTAPRLVHAVAAFRRLRQGVTLAWREPRRTGSRKFIRRRMTISRTLRSRVQSALRVGMRHIGLDHLRHAEQHHLRLLLDAVWEESMSRSNLPRELWQAKGDVAARARHTADNRRSELMQFLSWAEHEGFVSLHDLQSITLPESWTRFVLRAEGAPGQLDVVARRLAKIAFTRLHLPSPERLVDRGFRTIEDEIINGGSYGSDGSARTTLSKLRRAWNYCATAAEPAYPVWPTNEHGGTPKRLPDGGLQLSWWSAGAFFAGRPSLLDAPGFERQKQQAQDMKDWWMLSDPHARPVAQGGPLARRPKLSRQGKGRKRLGARHPGEETAKKPLTVVSRVQRFAISYDEPELRIAADVIRATEWRDLFRDTERLKRYVRWEIARNAAMNDGKCITGGARMVWYVYTLLWAYYAAPAETRLEDIAKEYASLDLTSKKGRAQARLLEQETAQRTLEIKMWHGAAAEIQDLILALISENGGEIRPKKDKTAIRASLDHQVLGRLADHLRDRRLERADRLLFKTRQLQRAGGEYDLAPSGIAWSVIDRTYCKLILHELMIRAHALLPMRPGLVRRTRFGVHLDPDTLEFAAIGRQDKVEKDAKGNVKRPRVKLDDIAWWNDPNEITDFLQAYRVFVDEARVWLLDHPTKTALRLRQPDDDEFLMISSYGIPWRIQSTYSTSFKAALTSAARSYNASVPAGESPINLPTGWGTRGVYVPRFLYGQRIRDAGGTFEDIAAVLGNSPNTAKRYYQDEQPGEAQNRVTKKLRHSVSRSSALIDSPAQAQTPLETLKRARAEFEAETAALELTTEEAGRLWAAEKERILAGLDK